MQEKLLERVYFIQEGRDYEGPIKIGRTYGDARARLNALQVANWRPLELLGQFWVLAGTERRLHEELSEHRVRGEWYRPHDDVWDEIEECADEQFFAKIGWGVAA